MVLKDGRELCVDVETKVEAVGGDYQKGYICGCARWLHYLTSC